MAYGLPFFFEKNEPSDGTGLCVWLQMDYVRGCKRIMRVVANGLWLVFFGKMRPSDAIFGLCVWFANGLCVWFANGLCVWLQLAYVFCFLLYILCIILPMK